MMTGNSGEATGYYSLALITLTTLFDSLWLAGKIET